MTEPGRRAGVVGAGLAAALLLYLLLWPLPVEPVAWTPAAGPSPTGTAGRLVGLERVEVAGGTGPESVVRGPDGWLYTGVRDGRILRFRRGDSAREVIDTGGRPLGLAFDDAGRLLVADGIRGLLRVDADGTAERLMAPDAGGGYLNDVAVARDGWVYATVPSRLAPDARSLAVMASRPSGRLLAHDPGADSTRTVLDSLHFPNGVAAGGRGAYLLLTETSRYRVLRHWLEGPRAGETEVLASNLPGFPDGLDVDPDGAVWVALASRRSELLDALHPHPRARSVVMRAARLWPFPSGGDGLVLRMDPSGGVAGSFRGPGAGYGLISSALSSGRFLYLGSFRESAVARVRPLAGRREDR